ncbi:hypothetical protein ACHQM5_025252 [Ranunculus cassubicifolius]
MKQDIIQEILLRLPVKSLARCKSLSKEWMEFISCNQAFHKSFMYRNSGCSFMLGFYITKHVYLIGVVDEKVRFLPTYNRGISVLNKRKRDDNDSTSLQKIKCSSPALLLKKSSPNFFNDPAVRVLGSSNGFLLCSLDADCPLNYIIINPINKLCMSLPAASAANTDCYTHGFFCRSTSPQLDTVVYYKVVRGITPNDWHQGTPTSLEIISSNSIQWSQFYVSGQFPFYMDNKDPSKIIVSETGLVYVPGFEYKQQEATTVLCHINNAILIFDQSKQESVHVMELPAPENLVVHECIGESDGLISCARNELGQLKIWRYSEQEGGCWSLVHNVSLERWVYHAHMKPKATDFCPEAFHPTDKNVIFLATDDGRLVYNLDKAKMDYFCNEKEEGLESIYYFFPYTCGLIGPHFFLSQD